MNIVLLLTYLHHTDTHIETFGAIALESDAMSGIVCIWARPFSDDTWHGKNPQDAVMMVPGLDVWKGRPEDLTREILSTSN